MFLAFETFNHALLLVDHQSIVSIKALQGYLEDGDNTSAVAGSVLELINGKWQWVAASPKEVLERLLTLKESITPDVNERQFYVDAWKALPDSVIAALEKSGQVVPVPSPVVADDGEPLDADLANMKGFHV